MLYRNDVKTRVPSTPISKIVLENYAKSLKAKRKKLRKPEIFWAKARIYARVIGRFIRINKEIKTYGSCMQIDLNTEKDPAKYKKKSCLVFHPKHRFKLLWNLFIMILLFYTATVLPYRICFDLLQDQDWTFIDLCIDIVFFCDILLNFNTALISLSGKLTYNRSEIAKKYIKGWFFIDLLSCIPLDYILTSQRDTTIYNRFLRILRVTRIYKILKILRLLKLFRLTRSDFISLLMQTNKFNSTWTRVFVFVLGVALFVHILGCIWYFISISDDSSQLTWIDRLRINDKDHFDVYIASIYFVFSTFTTVGYGDITPVSNSEKIFTIIFMAFGVWIYSYMIGALSSSIRSNDQAISTLKAKTHCIKEFAKAIKLPSKLTLRIKSHLKMNMYKSYSSNIFFGEILKDLPSMLKEEIMDHTNLGVVEGISFFCNRPRKFVNSFVRNMQLCFFTNKDVIYEEDDMPEEVYFIKEGKVVLRVDEDIVFRVYFPGSYFGEIEVCEDTYRTSTAEVCSNTAQIYRITKEEYLNTLSNYHDIFENVKAIAKSRKFKHEEAIAELVEAKLKESNGILSDSLLDSEGEEKDPKTSLLRRNDTAVLMSYKNDTPFKKKNRMMWEKAIHGKSCDVKRSARHKSLVEKHLKGSELYRRSGRGLSEGGFLKKNNKKKEFRVTKGKIEHREKTYNTKDLDIDFESIGIEPIAIPEYIEQLAVGYENTLIGIKARRDAIEEKVSPI